MRAAFRHPPKWPGLFTPPSLHCGQYAEVRRAYRAHLAIQRDVRGRLLRMGQDGYEAWCGWQSRGWRQWRCTCMRQNTGQKVHCRRTLGRRRRGPSIIWPPREATSSAAECPPVQRGRPVRGIPASESRDAVCWQDGRNAVETERRISGSCSPPYIPLLARGGRHAAPWISLYVAEGGAAP